MCVLVCNSIWINRSTFTKHGISTCHNELDDQESFSSRNNTRPVPCANANIVTYRPIARERLGKHIPAATNTQATIG
jgi:hypothetical protein